MDTKTFSAKSLRGTLKIPGDKSISHRSIILASIAEGSSFINDFLESEDCINTLKAFQEMGVNIVKNDKGSYRVDGVGLNGLQEANKIIYCGNSGTTMRLLIGLLSAQNFYTVLSGDRYLSRRPMDRIVNPLILMGAKIWSREGNYAPISIKGNLLKGIEYKLPIASAQVKSALILAGLYSQEKIKIVEPGNSRDHTERMLDSFGVDLAIDDNEIVLKNKGQIKLTGQEMIIPGDISSAAFFITAALITPNSEIILKNIGINHTRNGFLEIIKKMGANIELFNIRNAGGEPVADIKASTSNLTAVTIAGDIIPRLIDELPLLAVLSTQAEGTTIIKDAEELRVKESDRIRATVEGLRKLGALVEESMDGMIIYGPKQLHGGIELDCFYDHRIAMSFTIAGLISDESFVIKNSEAINISFPEFYDLLKKLI